MATTTRKTGNEPVAGTDPGGTRPAPGHNPRQPDGKQADVHVESGDRNDMPKDHKDSNE